MPTAIGLFLALLSLTLVVGGILLNDSRYWMPTAMLGMFFGVIAIIILVTL